MGADGRMRARATALRAGVIAAGRGDRLQAAATPVLKPLVAVDGRPLVERVLASIAEAAPREVAIIINEQSLAVRDRVSSSRWPFPIRWIVETTPSSMHSFLRVVDTLAQGGDEGPFLISTVDTVAPPGAFASFVEAGACSGADMTLAVVDVAEGDDRPLLVTLDGSRIVAFGAEDRPNERLATAGYYLVRASVLREAQQARSDRLGALRGFLARLLERGYRLDALRVPPSVDVDRPADIAVAERLLRQR